MISSAIGSGVKRNFEVSMLHKSTGEMLRKS